MRTTLVLISVALPLTACGGGSDESMVETVAPTSTVEAVSTTPPTPEPTVPPSAVETVEECWSDTTVEELLISMMPDYHEEVSRLFAQDLNSADPAAWDYGDLVFFDPEVSSLSSLREKNTYERNPARPMIYADGESVVFDGAYKSSSELIPILVGETLLCVLDRVGASAAISSRLKQTSAIDGVQTASTNGFDLVWSFHPDRGMSFTLSRSGA